MYEIKKLVKPSDKSTGIVYRLKRPSQRLQNIGNPVTLIGDMLTSIGMTLL